MAPREPRFGGRLPASLLLSAVTVMAACQPPRTSEVPAVSREALPIIMQVVPETVTIVEGSGADLEIRGAGFDPDSNTVIVGPLSLAPIRASANGTVIGVRLPDRVPRPGGAAPALWMSGPHDVQVLSSRGRSAVVVLHVRSGA